MRSMVHGPWLVVIARRRISILPTKSFDRLRMVSLPNHNLSFTDKPL